MNILAFVLVSALSANASVASPQDTTKTSGTATPLIRAATAGQDSAQRAQALASVRVQADRSARARYRVSTGRSSTRTLTPLREVPQSVTVLGSKVIADLGLQTMARAMEYVPGVTMGLGEGHRDAPTIRGQNTTADFFVDGVRDDAQYFRDSYNVSQIDVLKGANAMTFGRGGGGGVINRVLKQAEWSPTRTLFLETGSFHKRRLTLDAGQGLTTRAAARVNALHESSGSFRDFATYEKNGVNPTLSLLAGSVKLTAGAEHFTDRRTVDRGIPSANGRPSVMSDRVFVGDPNQSRSTMTVDGANVLAEFDNGHGVVIRSQARALRYDKYYGNVFASSALNSSGSAFSLGAYNTSTDRRSVFQQNDAVFTARRGAVRHTLLIGSELSRQITDNVRLTGYFDNTATSRTVSIAAPTISAPVTYRASTTDANNTAVANVAALYAQQQLYIGPFVQLVAGARVDRFAVDVRDHRNNTSAQRTDRMLSPRAGVVLTPRPTLSLYASQATTALPSSGDQFSSLTATTATLQPERFRNREIGVKWTPHDALELSTAWYRLDRSNSAAPDPANVALLVQTGRQRTNGVEFGITGAVTPRWDIIAGAAVQHARIVERTSAARAGATVPLVPRTTASLWNKVRVASRASVGAGVVHQGKRYAAIDNSVTLPSFTRVDGAVFVTLPLALVLQANVENLLGVRYFATSHGNNNIMPGAPRMLRLSLSVTP